MSENRHPAGTSIGGQWAPGSAGEVDLDDAFDDGAYEAAHTPTPGLPAAYEKALDRYSPIPDEALAAITEAADEHRDPSDESGRTLETEVVRVAGLPPRLEYDEMKTRVTEYGEVSARIDGVFFNESSDVRSAESSPFIDSVEDISDWDEDEDYRVLVTIPHGDLTDAIDLKDLSERCENRREIDRLVSSGDLPPWSVVARDDDSAHEVGRELRAARSSLYAVEVFKARDESMKTIDSAIEDVKAGRWDESKPLTIPDPKSLLNGPRASEVSEFNEAAKKYTEEMAEYERVKEISDEAHSLPEGPLRDYLVADRPEMSYRVPISSGRSKNVKRYETKTYTPRAPVIEELHGATVNFEAEQRRFDSASKFTEFRKAHESSKNQVDNIVSKIPSLQAKADQIGWNSAWGQVPKRLDEQ